MKLNDIGFYTLTDERAASASHESNLTRCELVLTARCNFHCPYCRHVGGKDMNYEQAKNVVLGWAKEGLQNIRFSGGEPTLYPRIFDLCALAKSLGIKRIALSTNGSASQSVYEQLIACGVNDFSVSLDACCAEDGDKMTGGIKGAWKTVSENIKWLATKTYVTVGVVLTETNMNSLNNIITFADSLGVSDIRIIPAAQNGDKLQLVEVDQKLLDKYPILNYRINNIRQGQSVRGLCSKDATKCGLVLDDIAVNQDKHYPCIIYMRESGQPIGHVNSNMRLERKKWYESHNIFTDPICKTNCLDVCIAYNNKHNSFKNERK